MAKNAYTFTARHKGLGKSRVIRSMSLVEGQAKVREQEQKWEAQWQIELKKIDSKKGRSLPKMTYTK